MSTLVPIKYVGLRDTYSDHLYGSGVTWVQGEVQPVRAEVALLLLRHPEFKDARKDRSKPIDTAPGSRYDDKPEDTEFGELPPLRDLSTLTKEQLGVFAKRNFGIDLDQGEKKEQLVERARQLMGHNLARVG